MHRRAFLRVGAWLAALVVGGFSLPGAAQTAVRGGTLVIGQVQDMKTLDPVRSQDLSEREIMYLVFNTLVRLDTDFSIKPELATSWQLDEGGQRIVFKLRPGVKFHDGTPLDAEAVKWNLDWRMDPNGKSPQRKGLSDIIQSVTVVDPLTLAIDLKAQAPGLLGMLAQREGLIESPTAAKKAADDFGSNPVGSGPFIFREWVRGNRVVVERNPNYWEDGKPYLDKIVLQNIAGAVIGIQRLRTGEIDLIHSLTPQDILQIQNIQDVELSKAPANRWWSLQWQVDKPPFDNLKLRQAVAYAVDRKNLIDIVQLGKADTAESPTPPGLWWYSADVKSYDYNPDKARTLLKEAGYPNGFQVALAAPNSTLDSQISAVVQDQLKAVGITANLEPVSASDFYGLVVKRAINFTPENWTQRPDPDGLFRALFYTKEWANSTGYSNSEVDALLDKARALQDNAARKPLYAKMQQIVTTELPYVPLFFSVEYMAQRKAVHGFVWIPDQIPRYRDLWKTAAK
jgi:peptide/nickel transport system substrate-binding protein